MHIRHIFLTRVNCCSLPPFESLSFLFNKLLTTTAAAFLDTMSRRTTLFVTGFHPDTSARDLAYEFER
jgi:hypothetical protein